MANDSDHPVTKQDLREVLEAITGKIQASEDRTIQAVDAKIQASEDRTTAKIQAAEDRTIEAIDRKSVV